MTKIVLRTTYLISLSFASKGMEDEHTEDRNPCVFGLLFRFTNP